MLPCFLSRNKEGEKGEALEHWGILTLPLLYLSLAFKRHRAEYYRRLHEVRNQGDWEGWTDFFLRCVCESPSVSILMSAEATVPVAS